MQNEGQLKSLKSGFEAAHPKHHGSYLVLEWATKKDSKAGRLVFGTSDVHRSRRFAAARIALFKPSPRVLGLLESKESWVSMRHPTAAFMLCRSPLESLHVPTRSDP